VNAAPRIEVAPEEPAPRPALPALLAVLRALDDAGVPHCHFKSNQHLAAALAGDTDLDLLVARSHARVAQALLAEHGMKRFDAGLATGYPAVEDWLGFDESSGRLIHLHVHYALPVGELHLKSYALPLERAVLEARVRDGETGVATSAPAHEWLLLLVRYALKARGRDRFSRRPAFRGSALREYEWLRERAEPARVRALAERELGPEVAAAVAPLLERPPELAGLLRLRRALVRALAPHRTWSAPEAALRRLGREAVQRMTRRLRRSGVQLPRTFRRKSPIGGTVVAFVGCDGAGKSTVLAEMRRWLGWKLDVYSIYFGSGDGPVSPLRAPLVFVRGLQKKARPARPPEERSRVLVPRRLSAARAVWALVLAREKAARLRAAERARQRGLVVICDRYPQSQVLGFNDGPLLAPWFESGAAWKRRLARWERSVYESASRLAPDLALKLDIRPEVAVQRKPDMALAECARRRAAVAQLDWGPRCRHLVIDAEQPLEKVLLEVKRAIWAEL
jgi:thymidylate kinase